MDTVSLETRYIWHLLNKIMPNIYRGQQMTFFDNYHWYAQVDVMTKIIIFIKNCKFVEFAQFITLRFLQYDHFVVVRLGMLPKSRMKISFVCYNIFVCQTFLTENYFPIKTQFLQNKLFFVCVAFCLCNLQ